jgi:hypothetical protein
MTDYTDLIERLRDKAFKRCGPTMEAVHTKTDEWKSADALEAQARRIEHLHNDMKFMDGKNDELRALLENDRYTIDELRARIAELEAALRPFADVADYTKTWAENEKAPVPIYCLRAARAALEKKDD